MLYKFFSQTHVVRNQNLQLLCYVIFFDILHHYGVIAASQICSVEKVLCRLTEQIFFRCSRGGGVMLNLVYDSMFLLRELCMHCVSSVMVSLIGFVSDKCSFVVAFVDGLFIYGYIFLRFDVHSG